MKFNKLEQVFIVLLETFRLFLGALLVLSLFYFNLIPKNSRDLWLNMNNYELGSTLFKISLVLLNIYFLLKVLEIIKPRKKSVFMHKVTKIGENISDYIIYLMLNFYSFINYLINILGNKLFRTKSFHYNLIRIPVLFMFKNLNQNQLFFGLIAIKLIPRLVFFLAFSYDVLIAQHLHYTFLCLPLLIISLLERFIICMLEEFYKNNWDSISSFIEKTETEDYYKYQFVPKFQNAPPHFVENFDEFFRDHYAHLMNIYLFYTDYKEWKHEKFPYIKISLIFAFWRLFLLLYILVYGII